MYSYFVMPVCRRHAYIYIFCILMGFIAFWNFEIKLTYLRIRFSISQIGFTQFQRLFVRSEKVLIIKISI